MSSTFDTVRASLAAFCQEGVYQRLPCGCLMTAHTIDPCGPALCLISNDEPCDITHSLADFLPIRWTP